MCRRMLCIPTTRCAVTVLTNEDASSAAGALARKIAPLVLGGASCRAFECGGGGGREAGAGYFYWIAGWEAGSDAVDGVVRCVLYGRRRWRILRASLKPLGVPTSFRQLAEEKRGGMTFRVFNVSFPDKKVRVTVYEEPDGKLEQYLVIAPGS